MFRNWYTVVFFSLAGLFLFIYIGASLRDAHQFAGWLLMASLLSVALGLRQYPLLKGYSFTIMIFAAVSLSMYYPQYFVTVGGFRLSRLITPLLQVIMFGMGTSLSLKDFAGVVKMPRGVGAGLLCQFGIMPILAFVITKIFNFPNEVAAGIILIGCCPSGLASNVMTYLARANLALSVSLTAVATVIAPLATPFLMEQFAGQYVAIDFWAMMWDITKIVIIPITGGLIFNYFLYTKFKLLDKIMPVISMAGIVLILVVITAAGRDNLLEVGGYLVVAVLIHNTFGYFLGYWVSRLLRMDERDCRTIAIEVGLQNAGLGSALALAMDKLATVGLAAAVFGPLMNITGSSLALWWRGRPLPEDVGKEED
ncbi:MAG: bile acid:sodium symporter family protein [Cyclobacteriaceae bacterium]